MSVPADRLTAVFDNAEATLLRNLGADTYRIIRTTEVTDLEGGETTTETYLETGGRCLLQRGGTRGVEGANGSVVFATADFVAQLPSSTVVTERDVLEVNGREFQVISVKPSGNVGVFTTVELEARS
jgi:hypothetical protein